MSVQTEISRLESAKEAISTAIAGKGVTVPAGTMLDGMAALIESIEAGGAGSEFMTLLGEGTFSGNDSNSFTLTHNLGVIPKVAFIYLDVIAFPSSGLLAVSNARVSDSTVNTVYVARNSNTLLRGFAKGLSATWTDETVSFVISSSASNRKFTSGNQFKWALYG